MGIYATVLALGFAAGPAILGLVGTHGWLPYLAGTSLFALAALPLLLARDLSPAVEHGTGRRLKRAPARNRQGRPGRGLPRPRPSARSRSVPMRFLLAAQKKNSRRMRRRMV